LSGNSNTATAAKVNNLFAVHKSARDFNAEDLGPTLQN